MLTNMRCAVAAVLVLGLIAASCWLAACKSTPSGPTTTPEVRSGAGLYAYRPVQGAIFQLQDISYSLDSVGIISIRDTTIITWIVKDTAVTFASGFHGMTLQRILSSQPADTTIISCIIRDSELAYVNVRVDTLKRRWLSLPLAAGAVFKSIDTASAPDYHIDSVDIVVSTPVLTVANAIRVTRFTHSKFFNGGIDDSVTSYYAPDYFLIKAHGKRTFTYPGSKDTYLIDDAVLITKPY